ncbi:MAG: hydrogenase maturation nickel metallochaperone HypA [Cyclobacteriaceae bacterium]|nr:hydrogenase maturation nickel metallochaperone HypA [Cyclobacteriaceae bacterium]
MHELSVTLSILDIAEKEVMKAGAKKVSRINLEIGGLAGIEPSALDFAWEQAKINTVLATAERIIENVPAEALCLECKHSYFLNNRFDPCPSCGSYFKDIIKGKELKIKSISIEY